MEGPTPVSALDPRGHDGHGGRLHGGPLHAALSRLARRPGSRGRRSAASPPCWPRSIALTQFDLKRILAYSTVSQLGYMFLALGHGQPARRDFGHVPPLHARLLQSPLVPRRGQRDARHGRRDRHARVRRAEAEDAVDALDVPHSAAWPWPASSPSPASGAKTPSWPRSPKRRARSTGAIYTWLYYSGNVHGLPYRVLYFPRLLPDLPRRGADSARRPAITPTSRRPR